METIDFAEVTQYLSFYLGDEFVLLLDIDKVSSVDELEAVSGADDQWGVFYQWPICFAGH